MDSEHDAIVQMIQDMDSLPENELLPLFPEITVHNVESQSELDNLIKRTDENCNIIIIDNSDGNQGSINNGLEQGFDKGNNLNNEIVNSIIQNDDTGHIGTVIGSSIGLDLCNQNNSSETTHDKDSDDTEEYEFELNESNKRGRKRVRNQKAWKHNVRKRLRQSGQAYIDCKGNQKHEKSVKKVKDCGGLCKFKCDSKINTSERKALFDKFWSLNDSEKFCFYTATVERVAKARKRTHKLESRRQYSFKYSFTISSVNIRVCKQFYLSTLDISAHRIQCFFNNKVECVTDGRGRHTKSKIPDTDKNILRDHIRSFQTVPSHYCRASSKRKYLEPGLSVSKMFTLYEEKCQSEGIVHLKKHVYRDIFYHEFNLGFHKPKKDMCDLCEEHKAQSQNDQVDDELHQKYTKHVEGKMATKVERDSDRNADVPVLCFDMQNVLSCPRANVSNFYYRRKLNVYNLTAHLSTNKKAYNAVWSEDIAGRGGNEIASALLQILEQIAIDFPDMKKIILWSDSCVPQNRNSIMTFALKHFLNKSGTIEFIEQKYSEPGHSNIQEVDNIHSHIEKSLALSEFFSPVSLLRVLSKVRQKSMKVMQLRPQHFYCFSKSSASFKFSSIPYTKVKHIALNKTKLMHVAYKTSFQSEFIEVSIRTATRKTGKCVLKLPSVPLEKHKICLPKEKVADIKKMIKYMPLDDRQFYQALFKKQNKTARD